MGTRKQWEAFLMLAQLWRYRGLVSSLTRRQFHLRYRQSALGLTWAFLVPLATLGAGILVFKQIAGIDTGRTSYELFTLAALVPWVFLASSLSFGIPSIVQDKALVIKLAFPRAVLPLGMVGVSFLDFVISGAIYVALAYLLGVGLHITALWVPLIFLVEMALVIGLVLGGSALNVFARDIRLGVPLLVQLWLLLTPVLYPMDAVPAELRRWFLANPMTGIVESFRRVLVHGLAPDTGDLLSSVLGSSIALLVGLWYFRATERRFADVI
jgi:lipopolysaccharide transport system permease protein